MDWKALLCETRIEDAMAGKTAVTSDFRTHFERDHDRIVFLTPFRRLQDKAQVWPLERNDGVRTRLTHTLEVSRIAAGLAKATVENLSCLEGRQKATVIEIATTTALMHDMGNPPFGHSGEDSIANWFEDRKGHEPLKSFWERLKPQQKTDFEHYDGNSQTFRLCTHLQLLGKKNLNLTCGTLAASLKYNCASHELDKTVVHKKKHGYLYAENDVAACVCRETGLKDKRHPIAFLVEAADDLAYALIDIEDGIRKGALTWSNVRDTLEAVGDDLSKHGLDWTDDNVKLENSASIQSDTQLAAGFRVGYLQAAVPALASRFKSVESHIMSGDHMVALSNGSDCEPSINALKKLAKRLIFPHRDIISLEIAGHEVIGNLMDLFLTCMKTFPECEKSTAGHAGKLCALLSTNYRAFASDRIKNDSDSEAYYKLLLLCDFISGMTDSFAVNLHRELTGGIRIS